MRHRHAWASDDLSKIGESPVDMSHRLFILVPVDMSHRLFILVPVEMSQTNSTFYMFSSFGFFH